MSIAFATPTTVITDRFVGNEEVALKLPRPKSIQFDNVVVAFTGSMALPRLVEQINETNLFTNAARAGGIIIDNLDLDKDIDYGMLIADGTSLYELDNQRGLYEMDYSAIGSGYQYVLGAYFVSGDPFSAMLAGCHFSPMASKPLDIWSYKDGWHLSADRFPL